MKTDALYVHIPFCEHICSYCDFAKVFYNDQMADGYLAALKAECGKLPPKPLRTIYIGGGTPSALSLRQLRKLLEILSPFVGDHTLEYTIEANPESLDRDKLKLLKKYGVNRLSIGVQTFNDQLVKIIERHHHKAMVIDIVNKAHDLGFDNISIDLMYGLPHQHLSDVKEDLRLALSLPITHLSYYSLILEEGTLLSHTDYQGMDEDEEKAINDLIDKTLANNGFHKYEVSNYAKDGYESAHNKVYWHYDNYYGVGCGATGKIDDRLIEHTRALNRYIRKEDITRVQIQSKKDTMFNHLMMSLRLVEGLDLDEFERRYHQRFDEVYPTALKRALSSGSLYIENHHLKTTPASLEYLNDILVDFL